MKTLTVIGLGLMGGSLALAAKLRGAAGTVWGCARRAETREQAERMGIADRTFADVGDAVSGSDFVALCVPVLAAPDLARQCAGRTAPGAIVTDVGSTKRSTVRDLSRIFDGTGADFVGSHPLAGTERAGLDAASADLFDNAVVLVTPRDGRRGASGGAVDRTCEFWERIGARAVLIAPDEHDRLIARTSHLPHMVAAVLVKAACDGADGLLKQFCGSGIRDTTRIAGGSEHVWHDIVKTNADFISLELAGFSDAVAELRRLIDASDFEGVRRFLADSRRIRQALGRTYE